MDDARLKAIEERAGKATAGPWENRWRSIADDPTGEQVAVAAAGWQSGTMDGIVVGALWYDGLNTAVSEPDAEFIAHARQDVPDLVAEVRRLRGFERLVLKLRAEYADDDTPEACDECEQCGKVVMCSFHSVLSALAGRTSPR